MSVRTTIFWVRAFSFRNPILGSFRGSFGYCGSFMNIANAAHVRHGYGDPPPYYQMEARLFSSRSECADIIVALEEGYKDHTKSSSFGKNLTKFDLASRICEEFPHYSTKDQVFFIVNLAKKFGVDHGCVAQAAKSLALQADSEAFLKNVEKFKEAAIPVYQEIFKDIGKRSGGVKFLVDLRGTILDLLDGGEVEDATSLRFLNNSLRDLLGLWFSGGMMSLERITWQSSCEVLERIAQYEAVHPVRHWTDIKHRVGPYRRCFIFTHSCMPNEPVVVLHTALMDQIGNNVQQILRQNQMGEVEDSDKIRAAVFYSVSSTQKGLRGIDLGMYLIRRAATDIRREFPDIAEFSTLSPIPSFAAWLLTNLRANVNAEAVFNEEEVASLKPVAGSADVVSFTRRSLTSNWFEDDRLRSALQGFLTRMCLTYLVNEKRRGFAYDSVANFHLGNGAEIWRLNWLADTSGKGLSQSFGLMVNFSRRVVHPRDELDFLQNGESWWANDPERCAVTERRKYEEVVHTGKKICLEVSVNGSRMPRVCHGELLRYPVDKDLIDNSNNYIFSKRIKVSINIQQQLEKYAIALI